MSTEHQISTTAASYGCRKCAKGKHRKCLRMADFNMPGGMDEGTGFASRCGCYDFAPEAHDRLLDPLLKDTSMPSYSARSGERVDITVRGYVTYNAGGYLNIADKPLEDGEPAEGCARLDIPEWMIVAEPVPAPRWPNGAYLLVPGVVEGDSSHRLYRYIVEPGFRGFEMVSGRTPRTEESEFLVSRDPDTFERLYRKGEED